MLFVILGAGQEKYAIPARDIVAIAPNATARRVPGTGRGIVGFIQYRSRAIPLHDLGELCRGTACVATPTTRILIAERKGSRGLIGIRAERVTSTARLDLAAFEARGVATAPYVTGVALVDSTVILRIDLQLLCNESASDLIALRSFVSADEMVANPGSSASHSPEGFCTTPCPENTHA
jgi:chemotaxis-related protein WspB